MVLSTLTYSGAYSNTRSWDWQVLNWLLQIYQSWSVVKGLLNVNMALFTLTYSGAYSNTRSSDWQLLNLLLQIYQSWSLVKGLSTVNMVVTQKWAAMNTVFLIPHEYYFLNKNCKISYKIVSFTLSVFDDEIDICVIILCQLDPLHAASVTLSEQVTKVSALEALSQAVKVGLCVCVCVCVCGFWLCTLCVCVSGEGGGGCCVLCVCACVHAHASECVHAFVYMCMGLRVCVCVCVSGSVWVWVCAWSVCVSVCVYLHACVCQLASAHLFMHAYVFVFMHACLWMCSCTWIHVCPFHAVSSAFFRLQRKQQRPQLKWQPRQAVPATSALTFWPSLTQGLLL